VCKKTLGFKNDFFPTPHRRRQHVRSKKENQGKAEKHETATPSQKPIHPPRDRTVHAERLRGTKTKAPITAEKWEIRVRLITTWMLDNASSPCQNTLGLNDAKDQGYQLRPDPAHSDSPRFM
jgi:hypothetical protein